MFGSFHLDSDIFEGTWERASSLRVEKKVVLDIISKGIMKPMCWVLLFWPTVFSSVTDVDNSNHIALLHQFHYF